MAAIMAAKIARYNGQVILVEHTSPSVTTLGSIPFRMAKRVATKFSYDLAHKVIAVSQGAARDLEKFAWLKPGQVETIYNPIDIERIRNLAKEPCQLSLPDDRPTIVHLSRLNPVKDPETLLHAFGIRNSKIRANFLIVGGDRDLGFLNSIIESYIGLKENIIFTGYLLNPYPYLALGDVFVLTSRAEGFGRVIVESMALGVPVVSTDCPSGPREILKDGKLGRLVPVGDPKAVAHAVYSTLMEHNKNDESIQMLLSHALSFDCSAVGAQWLQALDLGHQYNISAQKNRQ
jgi:glycosyltransferase involved in cell wall biosynthesis